MSGYGAVPQDDNENVGPVPTTFTLQVEKMRLIAYIAFWGMCFCAMIFTNLLVLGNTLTTCEAGEGMDCTILQEVFGFNNICAFWDYSPSTELTGMIFPIFEYTLVLYIFLDYMQLKNDNDNGLMSDSFLRVTNVLFWIKIVLVAWFRMIFICRVTGDDMGIMGPFGHNIRPVEAHTLGFFGMQFGLILIAFENVAYLYYRNVPMWGMSVDLTKKMAVVYLVALTIVTILKISWASSIFATGTPWIDAPWPHIFDRAWMLLAAVFPIGFAINGMKNEPLMTITFVNDAPRVSGN